MIVMKLKKLKRKNLIKRYKFIEKYLTILFLSNKIKIVKRSDSNLYI